MGAGVDVYHLQVDSSFFLVSLLSLFVGDDLYKRLSSWQTLVDKIVVKGQSIDP